MPELKRRVIPVEVNYECEDCGHGLLQAVGEEDSVSGEVLHECMICGTQRSFVGNRYPRIDYIGEDEVLRDSEDS